MSVRQGFRAHAAMRALAVAASLAAAATREAAASERMAGNVLAVDVERGEITMLDIGQRVTLVVDPEASIRGAGAAKTLSDLKRGDRIVVTLAEGETGHHPAAGEALRVARLVIAGPGRVGPSLAPGASVPGFASGLNARVPPR
jgi:hypothetical protein